MPDQHWIVVASGRGPATYPRQHNTEEAAIAEAKRLAQASPGVRFTVYASVCMVMRNDVLIVPLRPGFSFDDEIPF